MGNREGPWLFAMPVDEGKLAEVADSDSCYVVISLTTEYWFLLGLHSFDSSLVFVNILLDLFHPWNVKI